MAETRPAGAYALLEQAAERQRLEGEAARHLAASRSQLILGRDARSVFFAVLALRLKLAPDWGCGTMETDGTWLRYNPAFACGLSPGELLGVLVHEVMHCALDHPRRRGGRESRRWNAACDLAVNPLLAGAGFALPAGHLMPGEGPYAHLPPGLSAEEYYSRLDANSPDDRARPDDSGDPSEVGDPGGCGGVCDPQPADQADEAAEWPQALAQAREAARGRGDLPEGLARLVGDALSPPADWRALLREFVASQARNDSSWLRPNRRYLASGLYLPGAHSEELGEVVVAVDTSGSVGAAELAAFAREVQGVLDSFECSATVLYHDTQVKRVERWRSSDGPLVLDPGGGGGTSHECVFDWLAGSETEPACVVCLTDLETRFPTRVPDAPVLWAVVGDCDVTPPFGQVVRIGI